jgi:hypothetical protein
MNWKMRLAVFSIAIPMARFIKKPLLVKPLTAPRTRAT